MNAESVKTINCGNDFYPMFFKTLYDALESGEIVQVYVDCIGHNLNNRVQEIYKEKLEEKYAERLETKLFDGATSYSYCYKLKNN